MRQHPLPLPLPQRGGVRGGEGGVTGIATPLTKNPIIKGRQLGGGGGVRGKGGNFPLTPPLTHNPKGRGRGGE